MGVPIFVWVPDLCYFIKYPEMELLYHVVVLGLIFWGAIILFRLFFLIFGGTWSMWDLSSPTRGWTHDPCIGRWSLNHWTTREVPGIFFFLWLCFSLLVGRRRPHSGCGAQASHCRGSSCCGAQALGPQAPVAAAHGLSSCSSQGLKHRLSSCGPWAELLQGIWDLPGSGIEPASPALADGFFTTESPVKSWIHSFKWNFKPS